MEEFTKRIEILMKNPLFLVKHIPALLDIKKKKVYYKKNEED